MKYKRYNPTHAYDDGAIRAYKNGEKPISYWSKEAIIQATGDTIDSANLEMLCRRYETSKEAIKQELQKLSKAQLTRYALREHGVHYTGNYYRNTSFYRPLSSAELETFLQQHVLKPVIKTQLKLF